MRLNQSIQVMKPSLKTLIIKGLAVSAILCGAITSKAQTTQLLLDPNQPWQGYMNVFNLPADGGAYQFGSSWGNNALIQFYSPATAPYTKSTLQPNTNVWETTDTYWVKADKISPNKQMDANFYVQNDTLEGQNLTFSGVCISNTFASPYASTVFIKEFDNNYSVINSTVTTAVSGQPFSINLQTGGGTHIQYGFETIGPDCNPTNLPNLGEAIYQVQYPAIEPSNMNGQAAVASQNVTFTQSPTGNGPFTYLWSFNGTPLSNSTHIAGATANALIISNVTTADAGTYSVAITNVNHVSATASAPLVVIPLAQAQTNYAIDPSFEASAFAPVSSIGWFSYGGSSFANTNEWYSVFDPAEFPDVSVIDGSNCLVEYSGGAGSYTGVFQDRPAIPGQVYTASAWFFTPDAGKGYPLTNSATCNLQVQFYNSGGGLIVDYQSTPFTTNYPVDTWVQMPVTNEFANDFVTVLGTGPLIVSPPGTASMRIQPGYHAPDAASAGDVYIDMVDVTLQETTATPSVSGSNFKLTFPTFYGPQYNVMYKTNLQSGAWQTLTSVTGDGTVKTVTDPLGATPRFYIVNTQSH
jgi:Immunoglobulin I-set domain